MADNPLTGQDPLAQFRMPETAQASVQADSLAGFRIEAPKPIQGDPLSEFRMPGATPKPAATGDSLAQFRLPTAEWDKNTPVSETGASPSWGGRVWSFLNDPLFDAHKTFQAESGWGRGVENVLSSLSSPISLGLLAASFFGGELGLVGRLAPVLKAAGLGAEETATALKVGQSLVDAGFTLQQVHGLTQEVPAMMDALKFGDYEQAKQLAVESLATGGFAALGAKGVVRDAGLFYDAAKLNMPVAHLMAARRLIAEHVGNTQINDAESKKLMSGLRDMLKDEWKGLKPDEIKIRLAGMRTAAESGFDRNTLMAQHDFLSGVIPTSEAKPAAPAKELTPKEIVENEGLVYKGELVKGSGVHMFEHPDQPGKTAALNEPLTPEAVRTKMVDKLTEFGVKAELPKAKTTEAPKPIPKEGYEKFYSEKEKQAVLDEYKAALNLSPNEQRVAQVIRSHYDELKNLAAKHDVIEHFVNNYITRIWGERPDPSNEAVQNLMHQNRSGLFNTNVAAAMHRMFHTTFEGRMAGFKTLTDDPIALLGHYNTTLKNAISAREMLDNFREQEIKGMDGRPLAAIAGTGKIVGEDSGAPSVLVNPFKKRSIRIAQERVEEMGKKGELQQAISKGFIRQMGERTKNDGTKVPLYGWDTTGYKTIDSPIMRHWRYATPDTADDPAPVYLKGDVVVHPDIEKLVKTAIGADKSPITESKLGRLVLRASSEGKHLLLSFSPFHIVQEGLRAVMTGINPKPWNFNNDLANDPVLQYGVRHGLMLNKDHHSIQDYIEGVGGNSAIINKLPGLRTVHNTMQSFLFDKYIPELKARAYKSLVDRYRKYANREELGWDEHRIAEEAAAHANEAFGGLNYRLLGRSLTGQHVLRLSVLAPDWLESQGRFLARALNPESGGLARRDLARISLYTFAAARVINLLVSGQPHIESPWGVVVPGGKGKDDTVYSFRTIPNDLLHAISDPQNFIKGRVNPLTVRTGIEALEGRDEFGRRTTAADEAGDFVKSIVPIPTQSGLKRLLNQPADLNSAEQVARGFGASVYKYRTEAEKLAAQYASDRTESGPVSEENRAKHLRDIQLEDGLRSGEISALQVRQQLPKLEAQNVIDNATLSPLIARVKRLPLHDALSVFQLAVPTEKKQLKQLLWSKRTQWLQRHPGRKDRVGDPTWALLQKTYPDLANIGY